MQWDALLLSFAGLYGTIKLFNIYRTQNSLKYLCLGIAGIFFILLQGSLFVEGIISEFNLTVYSTFIVEWSHIFCLSFILSALTIFIRESKPVFAQFPRIYSALPLLIVCSYALVTDTYAIKEWLISIYQGGALLVAVLMYSVYTYRKKEYSAALGGVGLFLLTFILFWYVPGVRESYVWLWKLLLASGIVVFIFGLDRVHFNVKLQPNIVR